MNCYHCGKLNMPRRCPYLTPKNESGALKKIKLKRAFLLVDDHEIVRKGLKFLIEDFYPDALIDEASDGMEAVSHLKKRSYLLIILDIRMPRTNIFELLNYIVTAHPQTRILVFSMCQELLYGKKIINAGAHGYLSKEASVEQLKKAIEVILANRRYISDQLLELLISKTNGQTQAHPFTRLSAREFEIASFLLSGLPLSEIAKHVNLQRSTIGTYKVRIFEKLNISNVIELKELASLYSFF